MQQTNHPIHLMARHLGAALDSNLGLFEGCLWFGPSHAHKAGRV